MQYDTRVPACTSKRTQPTRRRLCLLGLLQAVGLTFLLPFTIASAHATSIDQQDVTLRMATGPESAPYSNFGEHVKHSLDTSGSHIRLQLVHSDGSADNLAKLKSGEVDLAMVQSDIAYQTYEGIRMRAQYSDVRLVSVLYREYLQIICRSDSDITLLTNLAGRRLYLGPAESGTYLSATDLLREIGLQPGVGYTVVRLDKHEDRYRALKNGRIDAVIELAGQLSQLVIDDYDSFRPLPVPKELVARAAVANPYFVPSIHEEVATGINNATLAVMSILAASNQIDRQVIRDLVKALEEPSRAFIGSLPTKQNIVPTAEFARVAPIPMHDGLRDYLVELGVLGRDYLTLIGASSAFLLLALFIVAEIYTGHYDRMGVAKRSPGYRILDLFARVGGTALILGLFVLFLTVVVEVIRYVETDYARSRNIENAFTNMRFRDILVWVFRFTGTGDANNAFPESPVGKAIAIALPFTGIATVFGLSLVSIDRARARRAQRRRGNIPAQFTDHILICGWNEKARNIVYALTSPDAPERHKVVVVAELDGDMPLESYNFHHRYVSYCRGDSADHQVLEKANAQNARAAIVLAGERKRTGRNIKSVLTVLALSKYRDSEGKTTDRKRLFITAEMVFEENRALFESCGADAIVPTESLANVLCANMCLCEHTTDFVMDMMTYDERSELYAIEIGRLPHWPNVDSKPDIVSLLNISDTLLERGVNLLAVSLGTDSPATIDRDAAASQYYLPLVEERVEYSKDCSLVFAADSFKDVEGAVKEPWHSDVGCDHPPASLIVPSPQRVILVGSVQRCVAVDALLDVVPWITTCIVTDFDGRKAHYDQAGPNIVIGDYQYDDTWSEAGLLDSDVVLLLTESHERVASGSFEEYEVNARAILISRFIRAYLRRNEVDPHCQPKIIAELYGSGSRDLLMDAGIDHIVSTNLVVERMLTKVLYARKVVTRFIMNLLDLSNGRYLYSATIDENLRDLVGCSVAQASRHLRPGSLLLGVLPASSRSDYRNDLLDFDYHFEIGADRDYRCELGDELILVLDMQAAPDE